MFSIRNNFKASYTPSVDTDDKCENCKNIIEGEKLFDALFPVNHLTGKRDNPLSLVYKILDTNKRQLLDQILVNLPTDSEFQGLDDQSQLEFVCDALSQGMPAERDLLLSQFSQIADVALPLFSQKSKEGVIEFKPEEASVESSSE